MITLKTLKDFEQKGNRDCILRFNLIRQEAIKHIKDYKNCQNKLIKSAENYEECFEHFERVIEWIKHFFNITSEDLK